MGHTHNAKTDKNDIFAHIFHGERNPCIDNWAASELGGLLSHDGRRARSKKEVQEQHQEANSAARGVDGTNYFKMYDYGGCYNFVYLKKILTVSDESWCAGTTSQPCTKVSRVASSAEVVLTITKSIIKTI